MFDYWQESRSRLPNTKKAKATQKRLSKVRARLGDGFSVEDLKLAVDGCLSNQFNLEGGHIDLELICRDDAHVSRYLTLANQKGQGNGAYCVPRAVPYD